MSSPRRNAVSDELLERVARLGEMAAEVRVAEEDAAAQLAASAPEIARRLTEELAAYDIRGPFTVGEPESRREYRILDVTWKKGALSRKARHHAQVLTRFREDLGIVRLFWNPADVDQQWSTATFEIPQDLGIRVHRFREQLGWQRWTQQLAKPEEQAELIHDLPLIMNLVTTDLRGRHALMTGAATEADRILGLDEPLLGVDASGAIAPSKISV